jgi:hypothetical protein
MLAPNEEPKEPLGVDLGAILGVILVFFAVIILGVGTGSIHVFIDLNAGAIVLGIVLGIMLIGVRLQGLLRAKEFFKRDLFCGTQRRDQQEKENASAAVQACHLGFTASAFAGGTGTLIGIIKILSQGLENPQALTCGMAVSLLTLFYGTILAIVFAVLRVRAAFAYGECLTTGEETARDAQVRQGSKSAFFVGVIVVAVLFIMFTFFFILTHFEKEDRSFAVTFSLDHPYGLQVGSPVKMNNQVIGQIENITTSSEYLHARARIKEGYQILEGSKVVLTTEGLVGDPFLNIVPSPEGEPIGEGEILPVNRATESTEGTIRILKETIEALRDESGGGDTAPEMDPGGKR